MTQDIQQQGTGADRAPAPAPAAKKANGVISDLSMLDTTASANLGAPLALCHPVSRQPLHTDNGGEITITLAGIDSEVYRRAQRAATNKRIAQRLRVKLTAEELEGEQLEMLARCTIAWQGIVFEGRTLDCNPANARRIYEALPWLREQVDEFIADRANFIAS